MDYEQLREAARGTLSPDAWAYYSGTAGGQSDADRDSEAWERIQLLPRTMQGISTVSTSVRFDSAAHAGGAVVSTPVMVAATAAHQLAHPEGECATARGAASAGALMVYSSSATVEIGDFGRAATGAWWAQVYLMSDRGISDDYVDRARAAGAGALVLTVDYPGIMGSASFRLATRSRMSVRPANYPRLIWTDMAGAIDPAVTPADIGQLAECSGLPVHVKGILRADDAVAALDAGAAGIVVSNHGRRQVPGVVAAPDALPNVLDAVGGRVPVSVDGGVRTGADVFRALAMGANSVGIGRSVLWALTHDGERGVASQIMNLTAELASIMASSGAASIGDLNPGLLRRP